MKIDEEIHARTVERVGKDRARYSVAVVLGNTENIILIDCRGVTEWWQKKDRVNAYLKAHHPEFRIYCTNDFIYYCTDKPEK